MLLRILPVTSIALAILCSVHPAHAALDYTFQDINHPQATIAAGSGTRAHGISGTMIVGDYRSGGVWHAFTYDGTTYTSFDHPQAASETTAYGISGSNIVGAYKDGSNKYHGFLYNGSTYTPVDHPLGANGTIAYAISGDTVVGSYADGANKHHGFIFDGATFTTLDHPLGPETWARGITGNTITGWYADSGSSGVKTHGFIYDGSNFSTFDLSFAEHNYPSAVIGSSVVGSWAFPSGTQRGFRVGDGGIRTDLQHPNGSGFTNVTGASTDSLLGVTGFYAEHDGIIGAYHGFIIVPEPSRLLLACALFVFARRRRHCSLDYRTK